MPLASLRSSPYNLSLGATVDAYIIAYNFYGDSAPSTVGSGANIVAVPDSPLNLVNDASITSDKQIGLKWDDGINSNGMPILDYLIIYDQSTGVWVTLASNLTQKLYQTTVGLAPGRTY